MASVLFFVSAFLVGSAFGDCPEPPVPGNGTKSDDCLYPSTCNNNFTASPDTGYKPENGPWYEVAVSPGGDHGAADSICNSYFPVGNGIFMLARCVFYSNGSCNYQRYIYAPIASTDGAYRTAGMVGPDGCDTCVYNDYALKQTCPGTIVNYRCYIYGGCHKYYVNRDYIVVYSQTSNITDDCYNSAVAEGVDADFSNDAPIRVPYALGAKCIYQIGNNTCINGERIPCDQRVYLEQ